MLAPGRATRKDYLYGGTLTLHDTWLASVKDTEEWIGETVFDIEACARAPAQSMYVQGSFCTYSVDLDPSHTSPAFQAEENVVCNFNCRTTQLVHGCHYASRRAVSDVGVYLPSLPSDSSLVVYPSLVVSKMPGAPTLSSADNMTAARQKVGPPSILGANPRSYFLGDHDDVNRIDMFNDVFSLYMNGRFFRQKDVNREFWAEDPTALTELLVTDTQWYEQYFRSTPKMLTSLLRHHNNSPEILRLPRNRTQGDIALIDFLLTRVMQRNFPKLRPASLWALANCMNKQRFTFGTAVGTDNLRGDHGFLEGVNPAEYEVVTIASSSGHSFIITRETPEGESEDIEYLTTRSYARLGSICHGTHIGYAQNARILRLGLDVDYGVRTGLARRNMIHFCVATNQRPLKRQGLYCYLGLQVAIEVLGLKVMYSKTAEVVPVEDRVPPEALCLTWRSPSDLGSMCLPNQNDLIKPRGPDAAQVPIKKVGEIFKASPMLRPRPVSGAATSSLPPIAEGDQPTVIDDDEDTGRTGTASGSAVASQETPAPTRSKGRPLLKSPPVTRPKVMLKSPPVVPTRAPPPVERYAVPKGPVVPVFDISDFHMVLPGLPSSIASSPAATLAPKTPLALPSTVPSKPKPMAPPAVAAPKPRPPSREQVQIEVDAIMREVEEKRTKRTKDQQQLHDAMLSAIFKSVFEDTVPDSAVGIYSSGEKDRMGCDIPKVIDFRSLPVVVQDDLMRADS